jgi:DNA-binding NtrC family response regulator
VSAPTETEYRVLLVDDEAAMCELAEAALGRRGFRVTWCTTAAEAIRLLGDNSYDVVVTDLGMTGIGGLDLCAHIVERHPELPVVVVTGDGDAGHHARRLGARAFLVKPVKMDELSATLRRVAGAA